MQIYLTTEQLREDTKIVEAIPDSIAILGFLEGYFAKLLNPDDDYSENSSNVTRMFNHLHSKLEQGR